MMQLCKQERLPQSSYLRSKTYENLKKIIPDINQITELIESADLDKYEKISLMIPKYTSNISDINNIIMYCVTDNHLDLLKKIVEKNDYNSENIIRDILCIIVENNHEEIFRFILDNDTNIRASIINVLSGNDIYATVINDHIVDSERINLLEILREYGIGLDDMYMSQIIKNSIKKNKINLVNYLISYGFDIPTIFDDLHSELIFERTPRLFYSSGKYTLEMIHILEENGVNILKHINKIMVVAAENDFVDLLIYCMDNGADIHYSDDIALGRSCTYGRTNAMVYLLQNGANIQSVSVDDTLDHIGFNDLKILIEYGLDICPEKINHIFNEYIGFYFPYDLECIQYFLKYDVDISCIFKNKLMLEGIVYHNKLDIIKFLAENYFDDLKPELDRLFITAASNGQTNLMAYLLDLGADSHTENDKAFLSAIFFGHIEVVKLLLSLDMDIHTLIHNLFMIGAYGIDAIDHNSNLFKSAHEPIHQEFYYFLITNSSAFNTDYFHFGTDHLDIFKLLIQYNVTIPNNSIFKILLNDPIYDEILEYFIQNGMNINEQIDKPEYIPLVRSVNKSNYRITKMLLDHSADPDIDHSYPVIMAAGRGNLEIIRLLLDYGAHNKSPKELSVEKLIKHKIDPTVIDLLTEYNFI